MFDFKKELDSGQILLYCFPNENRFQNIIFFLDQFKESKICYITLNRSSEFLKSKIGEAISSNIFFIDCSFKLSNSTNSAPDTVSVDSPTSLTQIEIELIKALKTTNFKIFIFDSLSDLIINDKNHKTIRFTSVLIEKIRQYNVKGVFICLPIDLDDPQIVQISVLVDRIINLNPKVSLSMLRHAGLIKSSQREID